MNFAAIARTGCVLLMTFTLLGCGPDTGGKVAVAGSITLHETPLDQGTISFYLPDVPTPAAECLITDGKYSLPAEQGLLPGKYTVRIRSTEEFEITPDEYAAGKTAPPGRERIPANYNSESTQSVEVQPSGRNTFDFQIE